MFFRIGTLSYDGEAHWNARTDENVRNRYFLSPRERAARRGVGGGWQEIMRSCQGLTPDVSKPHAKFPADSQAR